MKSYVVVAIPSQDDYVWKLSSEKVPHMTLLFLGDKLENVDRVAEFVDHVASTSLCKFGMDVDRRGVLGSESADVLFFGDYCRNMLEKARSYLLGNDDIQKAYQSVEQYPEWIPHLTMGYPATPAKIDEHEHLGLSWVNFDRIALWTGDYEGVEFPLKNEYADELRMAADGEAFLEHYGVKGMRWGVVRDHANAVRNSAPVKVAKAVYGPSQDAKKTQTYQLKAKVGGVRTLNNHEMRQVINRMELEQRYRDLYGERQYHDEAVSKAKRFSKKGARWAGRLLNDILKDAGASWLKRPGSNASGRTSARAWETGKQFGTVIDGAVVTTKAIGR